MFNRLGYSFFVISFFIQINSLNAQSFHSFNEFKTYIEHFAMQEIHPQPDDGIEVHLVHIDDQMKLPNCSSTIEASLAQEGLSASNSVILRCRANPEWVIYIPIQIKMWINALSTARRIMPAEIITENDFVIQKHDKFQLYEGFFQDKNEVIGQVATQLIPAGKVFSKRNLKPLPLIKRNQTMTLILKHGPIEISMQGIAKSDGFFHDVVKVINPSSRKIVDAIVVGNQTAEIIY